jgi:D-alanyl-D-alanine dipeptidase
VPGYGVAAAWLREDAARALAAVQAELATEGLGLLVHDGYRPRRATEAMVRWAEASGRTDLLDDGWIARRSMHNVGDAVDLTLVDLATGAPLDMGSPYDAFVPRSRVRGVEGEPLDRRLRLRAAMERHGFVPYELEWWHFTIRRERRGPALDVPYGG